MEMSYVPTTNPRALVRNATPPCLDQFCRLDRLDLTVVAQEVLPSHSVLTCSVLSSGDRCPNCDDVGVLHDTVTRRLAHVPNGWWPTILEVQVRRYRCPSCSRVWRQNTRAAAEARSKLTRHAVVWALKSLVIDRMSISRIAAGLGVAWNTANTAVLAAGQHLLINDPTRLDGVKVIGVDEHAWQHVTGRDRYVTVIIDLTPVRDKTGPARLLDMVAGRSKKVFKDWLAARDKDFRDGIEQVAMDGFTGFKSASVEELPTAVEVMDPFHVVALAGQRLDETRQRIQKLTMGHRGRSGDPLYGIRATLRCGYEMLRVKQKNRIEAVFTNDAHAVVEITWTVYQNIITAYRNKDRGLGKQQLTRIIDSLKSGVPALLPELATLGRTLNRRRVDVLAYFDHPGTSNGPTEAINGRLEHLRGTALGFRNLAHYIARSLLDSGGFRPLLHSLL